MNGLACPLLRPVACDRSYVETGFPARRHLAPSCKGGRWRFTRGYATPVLDACGGVDCLGTCIIDFYIERMAFY
jgi:hypothetical protein